MLEFRTIALEDKEWIDRCLAVSDRRGCEYSFSNNFAWHRSYNSKICGYKDFYICMTETDMPRFIFPAGSGDISDVLHRIREYADGRKFAVTSLDDEKLAVLENVFPSGFKVLENEDGWDYIYNVSDLALLSGKKYHNKRNLIAKTDESFRYSIMTENDFDDCIAFSAEHYNSRNGWEDHSQMGEQYAIFRFFENYAYLGLSGGVLRKDGKVIAFTIGEKINSDTVDIHIEKADPTIVGAYQLINKKYAEYIYENNIAVYINREEDLGIAGLRQSKRSYFPTFMQVKKTAVFE